MEAILKTVNFMRKFVFGIYKRNTFAKANIRNKKKASSWKNFLIPTYIELHSISWTILIVTSA